MRAIGIVRLMGIIISLAMLGSLQYSLWVGDNNLTDLYKMNVQIENLQKENKELRNKNNNLHADVIDIKNRPGAIERKARYDLGLIKKGESFYQIIRSGDG
ncbi:MAG: cell division protein FtsB [Acidiferrobacteraceae bacterium]|nr:cell division protein FtsB [Acidiferrobacteraceae bacterium]